MISNYKIIDQVIGGDDQNNYVKRNSKTMDNN